MIKEVLFVGIGGMVGSMLRYVINLYVSRYSSFSLPMATLFVNVVGSALLVLFLVLMYKWNPTHTNVRLLLTTGFCGGLTTFSAFALETVHLLQANQLVLAILNIFFNVCLAIGAVYACYLIVPR